MKYYIWAGIVVTMLFLTIFLQGVQDAVLLFVIAGIIPGTSIALPPFIMLILAAVAMFFVLRIGRRETRKIALPPLAHTKKSLHKNPALQSKQPNVVRQRSKSKRRS